jgi:hypothetical protein
MTNSANSALKITDCRLQITEIPLPVRVLLDAAGERLVRQFLVARNQTSGDLAMYYKIPCSTTVISGLPPN